VTLVERREASLAEASLLSVHSGSIHNFDPEVVDRPAAPWTLDQDQLERRLCDREVGIARTSFGGLGAEQLGIKGDGLVDVIDMRASWTRDMGNLRCDLDGCPCRT
jgi:hypothetical protein